MTDYPIKVFFLISMAGRKHEIPISFFANFSYHVSNFNLNAASKSFLSHHDSRPGKNCEKCLKEKCQKWGTKLDFLRTISRY